MAVGLLGWGLWFLEKPVSTDKLLLTGGNILRLQRLESENRQPPA
jgi:hypothetical protein